MIPLAEPRFDGNEARYLLECLDTGYVSSAGAFVGRFEREFAASVGARHAVACASGTAALHVALRLAGARAGSLVAVSDFTFIASANAVAYTGADLLLVDSTPDTWTMDTELLHDEVLRRAKHGRRLPDVVEVVHVLGHPADLAPLLALRDRFGIRVVEDAAEALGASWRTGGLAGRQVGTVGDMGCFSFNGNKIITSGGGGMLVTDDGDLASRARHLTTQAKLPGGYVHDTVGYNYRLTNIAAALGTAQLEQLPGVLRAKRAIAARYAAWLAELPLTPAPGAPWADPTYWLYSVRLAEAPPGDVVADLIARQILTRRLWPPLHGQRPYAGTEVVGQGVADDLYRCGISLPSSAHLTEAEQHTVVTALTDVLCRRQP
jgi:dTDP-4-amino-4,6-dideoxygalactose transaminase